MRSEAKHLAIATMMAIACQALAAAGGTKIEPAHRPELVEPVQRLVEEHLPALTTFYRECHENPELSLHEEKSAARLADRLRAEGYDVTTGVGGTGVVAVMKNGDGPTLLIRADTDALPVTEETGLPYASKVTATQPDGTKTGVMHACGHDTHQTVLVGTSRVLARLKDRWRGTVVLIGQPAEEFGQGAQNMIADGLFDRFPRPDACIALHVSGSKPAGTTIYTPGWSSANVDSVDITIRGRGGHGAAPDKTVDPIVTAAHVIVALQTIVSRRVDPIEPAVVTVGSIHGGSKHNIIPDEVKLQLTVRSYSDEVRKLLLHSIRQITVDTCRAMGCTEEPIVNLSEDTFTAACYNDPALTAEAAGIFKAVFGDENVVEERPRMGGEDFGEYARRLNVPGFMFNLGTAPRDSYEASLKPGGPVLPAVHSSRYAPDLEPSLRTGVRAMSALALAILDPAGNAKTQKRKNAETKDKGAAN